MIRKSCYEKELEAVEKDIIEQVDAQIKKYDTQADNAKFHEMLRKSGEEDL